MRKLLAIALLAALWLPGGGRPAAAREETWEDQQQYEARNRINHLIKGLDAPFRLRLPYVRELVAMADGKLRNLLLTQLIFALDLKNSQITQGVVEIYSRISDPATIPILKGELLYDSSLDVRRSIILHLPSFYVADPEARAAVIDFFEKAERYPPERLLDAMREPPLTGGRYSNVRDKLRREIEAILVEQLEPVGAVMQGMETAAYHKRAYEQLKSFLAVDLGHRKDKWREFWGGRGREFVSPLQSELFDTLTAACRMLANMGAEGTEELCAQVRWMLSTPFATERTAALEMLSAITAQAVAESRWQRAALAEGVEHQAEKLWRQRRLEACARLQKLALELAGLYLGGDRSLLNLLLIDCLGETRLPEAMPFLRRTLRSDNTSLEITLHVAGALGKIGTPEAVRLLTLMAEYQGIAVRREEQVHEYHRVRAALRALGEVTGHYAKSGEFVPGDPKAAKQAVDCLAAALADRRHLVGAPDDGLKEEQTVAFVVRKILQETWRLNDDSFDPQVWKNHYRELVGKK
ncbi:MAG: HEAT repeat domain-containing protein [Planctomycetes bacterium]|nr:HEAT repeat domain-containing protein [Planctomycetota bacterium]